MCIDKNRLLNLVHKACFLLYARLTQHLIERWIKSDIVQTSKQTYFFSLSVIDSFHGYAISMNTLSPFNYSLFIEAGWVRYVILSLLQLPNHLARIYTATLEGGRYSIQFAYHAYGNGTGGLNVYTRSSGSQFAQLVWYYASRYNGTANAWREVRVEVNQQRSFAVRFNIIQITVDR